MIYINNKEKLNKIRKEKDIFVITDFDRTLTTKQSEPSMGVIPKFLGGKCLEERLKLYNHYRPIELDYSLDEKIKQKEMRNWARSSFKLVAEYITTKIVEDSLIDANLHLREGAKEYLKELETNNIPVIVMSSGVGNIVEGFMKKENCLTQNISIVSNFYEFKDGKACIDLEGIMATSNKEYERIPKDLKEKVDNAKAGLLFGDLVEDLKMINKKNLDKTLTIGFLDDNMEDNLERFNKDFDIVLTNGEDFKTIKEVLING